MNQENLVIVSDVEGQILFSCCVEKYEEAFEFAKQMEELGIEVQLQGPSVVETLGTSLGADSKQILELRNSFSDEIEGHLS